MQESGGGCAKPPRRLRVAVCDTPKIMAKALSDALKWRGHDVVYEGPLRDADEGKATTPEAIKALGEADVWLTKWSFCLRGENAIFKEVRPGAGIVTLSVGTDHIDVETLEALGIRLMNTPTSCSISVAEHAMALAMRALYTPEAGMPHVASGQTVFSHFSDECTEQTLAQMLMRSRQITRGMLRVLNYDYNRLDEPWTNDELSGMKVSIVGRDRDASLLAYALKFGFNCNVTGMEASESLEGFGIPVLDRMDYPTLHSSDYVFLCTEKYGQLGPARTLDSRSLGENPEDTGLYMMNSNVAVLGSGRIGSIIARMAKLAFDCDVKVFNRGSRSGDLEAMRIRYVDSLEDAISCANFVFIALPLNEGTKNLVNVGQLSRMAARGPRVIVNVTRDEIIDSEALYGFISRGAIMAYATDVLPKDKVLWSRGAPDELTRKFVQHVNVIATPHEGDCSKRSLVRLVQEALSKLESF